MGKLDWLKRKTRGIHITIRDVDCDDFDVDQMVHDFDEMGVEFFSFFCGGYVTTYPTDLEYQRMSPWLNGRDLTGEIVEKAHEFDMKVMAFVDLGYVPELAALENPDWLARDSEGNPRKAGEELYRSCPLGGYHQTYARKIVGEIVSRYDVDGIKFGGGSYGFGSEICHCDNCRQSFYEAYQREIPEKKDWEDPNWRVFLKWRYEVAAQVVQDLSEMVKSFDPELLFMGNATCFGDPGWTTRASLDMEEMIKHQDAIQVEAQTRVRLDEEKHPHWQSLYFPGEEAKYLSTITDKPAWVVCSYFVAWPWRRSAMPVAEQKVYLAQIAANGGSPMVNLSGGPPATHHDKRGFQAMKELYLFLKEHREYYDYDDSGANVAVVYSQDTLVNYGQGNPKDRYVDAIRGVERALRDAHIPFDVPSIRSLDRSDFERYDTIVLPCLSCLPEEKAELLREFVNGGGGLIATYETSLYEPGGERRNDFLLSDLFGASYRGISPGPIAGNIRETMSNSYLRLNEEHPVLDGLWGNTEVVLCDGSYCAVEVNDDDAAIPLSFFPPFRVFPEGISYGRYEEVDVPMAVASEHGNGGRVVYFPNELDKYYLRIGFPDLGQLMVNAVRWTNYGKLPLRVKAPKTVDVSLREKEGLSMVHLINFTGGPRLFDELVPIRDIEVELALAEGESVERAFVLSTGEELTVNSENGVATVVYPELVDYDVIVFEKK